MVQRRKNRRLIIILSFILFLMSAGYAAFETQLNINGTANVTSVWDVEITNISINQTNGLAESVATNINGTLTANIEADLYAKGDYIIYDVTIQNKGSLDAYLNSIEKNVTGNDSAIKISVTGYTKGEVLRPTNTTTVQVKIEYNANYDGNASGTSSESTVTFNYLEQKNTNDGGQTLPGKHKVTYDCVTNGGEDCTDYNEYLYEGDNINLSYLSSKTGYTFIGWNTNSSASSGLSELSLSTSDITLYAIYKDNTKPVVTLNPNNQENYIKNGIDVSLNITDSGDGLKANQNIYYAWSTSNTTSPTYTNHITTSNSASDKNVTVTIPATSSSALTGTYYLWIKDGIEDMQSNKSLEKISGAFHFDNTTPTLSLTHTNTTKSITVVATAQAQSNISKYEYSIDDGTTWIETTNNTYTFDNLVKGTYQVKVRVTSGTGLTNTVTTSNITLAEIEKPTYSLSNNVVTINYPNGCGSTYTCTYSKDGGAPVTVTSNQQTVTFTDDGNLVATVSDGTNTESSSYTYVAVCKNVNILGQDVEACIDNKPSQYVTNANGVQFNDISSDTNGKGLYLKADTKDDTNPIYYYRGAVTNNNVLFGGFCWKIVRTTDTGGTKLIYNGTPTNNQCLNTTGTSTQIGTSAYNSSYNSPADVGYMYGTRYTYDSTDMSTNSQSLTTTQTMLSSTSLSTNYYYGDGITYDSSTGKYSLTNPAKVTSTSDYPSLVGKYTFRNSTETYTNTYVYYIAAVNGSTMYYEQLSGGNYLNDIDNIVVGTDITDNGNNTYTITTAETIKKSEWYSLYANYKDYYTCNDLTDTCSNPRYITATTKTNYTYVVASNKLKLAQSIDSSYNLQNPETIRYDSWYKGAYTNNSNYKDYYICSTNEQSCTAANIRRVTNTTAKSYSYALNYMLGSSVTYTNGEYTVNNAVSNLEYYSDTDTISTHHYFCLTSGSTTCNEVGYLYYYTGSRSGYYIKLSNGKTVEDALDEMLTSSSNTNNSTAKTKIDNWYNSNMTSYTNKLEDTIWCNDRSINTEGTNQSYINNGWKPDGGSTNNYLYFSSDARVWRTYRPTLDCPNKNDAFTVDDTTNGNGALTYPVALLTPDEIMYAGGKGNTEYSSFYLYTNQYYWTNGPASFGNISANEIILISSGSIFTDGVNYARGLRPAVSLAQGIEASSGDGSAQTPYVVN